MAVIHCVAAWRIDRFDPPQPGGHPAEPYRRGGCAKQLDCPIS